MSGREGERGTKLAKVGESVGVVLGSSSLAKSLEVAREVLRIALERVLDWDAMERAAKQPNCFLAELITIETTTRLRLHDLDVGRQGRGDGSRGNSPVKSSPVATKRPALWKYVTV